MKVSETWLREWVNPPVTTEQLVAQLTMAGLEVDSAAPVAGAFEKVVVAKVLETARHPQADKLTICQVDCGQTSPIQIVCGAANVRTGLTVALALIGSSLPNGMVIKETKLRGELSQGMLCSATELGLSDKSEGIIELPIDAQIGADLRAYMALNDSVLDIDLTPNRADCFSVLGIAREVATLNQLPLRSLDIPSYQPTHDVRLSVQLIEPAACPQYVGRVIRQVNPHAETPLWLSERLRRAGIRPIHPVVDVTNYVMLELGQPMHAFNQHAIDGGIKVRFSHKDEKLTLLDEQQVTLHERTLVIADNTKALAIAGVMGGADSAVHADTTDIFLESAYFNPQFIAGVARQYGLCTESSQRFERGVDPAIQAQALDYATQLLLQIVGGEVGPAVFAKDEVALPRSKQIQFHPEQVQKLTGVEVLEADMISTLQGLGITTDTRAKPWVLSIPTYRFDIELDVDIVEEIIRIYGYDRIVAQPMIDTLKPGAVYPLEPLSQRIASVLKSRGYHEIISYSFVDPELQQAIYPDAQPFNLLNPISSELSQMRVGLWPGLIAALIHNSHRQQSLIKLFETGTVFDTATEPLTERASIAGIMSGEWGGLNWSEPTRALDFYDLKGDVQAIFDFLGVSAVRYLQEIHPGLHPGKSAEIVVGEQSIGWVGVLHPRLAEALSLDDEVLVFEFTLAHLLQKAAPQYQKISKFPSVRRDLSFLIENSVSALQIERSVREVKGAERLTSFDIFDVYMGNSIPEGKKSVAIALTLQDATRTLVDDEVNSFIDAIVVKLGQDFAITLRD
jgi:phenylalanyl-tRNA synthetase beta chain